MAVQVAVMQVLIRGPNGLWAVSASGTNGQ